MRGASLCEVARPDQTAGIYTQLQRTLKTNMVPSAIQILAGDPCSLESFWEIVEPLFFSRHLRRAADEVRRAGCLEAARVFDSYDCMLHLSNIGYSREDNRQIRYVVESFFALEPVFVILSGLVQKWASGVALECLVAADSYATGTEPYLFGRIESPAVDDCRSLLGRTIERYGGECPDFLRTLSLWPEYAACIQEILGKSTAGSDYLHAVAVIADTTSDAVERLCGTGQSGKSGPVRADIIESAERSAAMSFDMILLACALRTMLVEADTRARRLRAYI